MVGLFLFQKFELTKKTVNCSFIADEEIGGDDGMKEFVVSDDFKSMNIGFALDEGLASPDEVIPVYYGERNLYWVNFKCRGKIAIKWKQALSSTTTGTS